MNEAIVLGAFDDMRSSDIRFLHKASTEGLLHVLLLSDDSVLASTGLPPKFPLGERRYLLESLRYVHQVVCVDADPQTSALPKVAGLRPAVWVVRADEDHPDRRRFCERNGMFCRALTREAMAGLPLEPAAPASRETGRRKVVVTGCYDWLHSGHVRFFEEVSALGDLHVIVGHDANIRLLKGEGHPLFSQDERRYVVQAVRFVHQALISSGNGWMDAEPEILKMRPDVYAVNEDGDKPEKREFCRLHDIEYAILKRLPKPGLPRRESTRLRGF